MRQYWRGLLAGSSLVACFVAPPAWAFTRDEAEATAHLLAVLLDAGREVIDRNQTLIDDPHRGFKGFTPEAFEAQLGQEFRTRAGIALDRLDAAPLPRPTRDLLSTLVQASKDVVADAQVVINQRGIGYKNFIPATFGSQAAARFSKRSPVRLKQTARHPRNPKNEPDNYEAAVLDRLMSLPGPSAPVSELTDDGKTLRMLSPIYYDQACLKCHGGPAGEQDVSGYPKEGATLGSLAGAISVMMPLDR